MRNKVISSEMKVLRKISAFVFPSGNFRAAATLLLTIFAAGFYASLPARGQSRPDAVDPTFNAQVRTASFGIKSVYAFEALPDGKTLIAGHFNSYNEQPTGGLVRLNADGTLDSTFNNSVVALNDMQRLFVQPDGKIIVSGPFFTLIGQTAPPPIVRLNQDGNLDSTFSYTTGGNVGSVVFDAGGRLLVSGVFQIVENGAQVTRTLIRLNPNGSLDTSFRATATNIGALGVQGNKVIVSSSQAVDRLNEDGSFDATFTRAALTAQVTRGFVQSDRKILILAGARLFRLNENGGSDTNFQTTNFPIAPQRMILTSDGKITTATDDTPNQRFLFNRVLPNGIPDSSFTTFIYPYVLGGYAVHADGSVLIDEQTFESYPVPVSRFTRLSPNGIPDSSFNAGNLGFQVMSPGRVWGIAAQPDGKVFIGGEFGRVNNASRSNIARLNADGGVDASFQINTGAAGNRFTRVLHVFYIAAQPDGKLIVSGNFDYILNGVQKRHVVRLNADGSIDPTFNLTFNIGEAFDVTGSGRNKPVILSDGKLLFGTSRLDSQFVYKTPIKLNGTGAAEASFNPTVYAAQQRVFIFDIAVQPDGKILIAGRHDTFPLVKSFVARLNADGTVDPTFQTNEETDREISAFVLLPNGKILIAKGDTPARNSLRSRVLRLNGDGSADNSFAAGTGVNGRINALLLLSDGKILAGGKFTTFNGQQRKNLALLSAGGSLETINYNVSEEVLTLAADNAGRVLVGGDFTSINVNGGQNFTRSYIARLTSSASRTRFDFDGDGRADLAVFNPTNGGWSILSSQTNHGIPTQFGAPGDRIAPADFDGDGKTDVAVYRPSQGVWYVLQSSNGFTAYTWGAGEDKPYPADFDGDGKADIAVWRPSNGIWYILQSSGHYRFYQFGALGDIPVPADYDGDNKTDVAIWRPSNGTFYWLASASGNHLKGVQFGTLGDIPAVADYNGDNKADLVVFRPSQGIWHQYLTNANGSFTFSSVQFGQNGDEPVAADYDGDGKTDIAVRRQGVWHLLRSSQGYSGTAFGSADSQAVLALPNQ